jgi:hypothetical protein
MSQRDGYVCDVVVMPDSACAADLPGFARGLSGHGLSVREVVDDPPHVQGSIDASRIRPLDDLPGVEYVRTVFCYVVDYPPGDPRDTGGASAGA